MQRCLASQIEKALLLEVYGIGALVALQRPRDQYTDQAKERRGFTLARDLNYGENWPEGSLKFSPKGSRRSTTVL